MLSIVEIWNNALAKTGSSGAVNAVDEASREAELCRQFYPSVRRQALMAAHWSAGKRSRRLALLKARDDANDWADTDPSPGYTFAYAQPADMLHPRYTTGYAPFEVGVYWNGTTHVKAINSNVENLVFTYTADEEDTSLWSVNLETAVWFALAAMIVSPLTGSSRKMQALFQEANHYISMARQSEANFDDAPIEHIPDWLQARGISGPTNPNRFIYPVGAMFSGAAV